MKTLFREMREYLLHRSMAYIVLVMALSLTGPAWYYVTRNLEKEERRRFEDTAEVLQEAIEDRLRDYVRVIRGARQSATAGQLEMRDQWDDYFKSVTDGGRHPALQELGYVAQVTPEKKGAHVAAIRREGFSTYSVRPDREGDAHFPVVLVAPFDEHKFGYDLFSEPRHRIAMEQARDTGRPTATEKVSFVKKGMTEGTGFSLYIPLYRRGQPRETAAERRSALAGLVYGALRTDRLLGDLWGKKVSPTIHFRVLDGTEVIYDDSSARQATKPTYRPRFTSTTTLEVAGRIWTLHFSTLPSFDQESRKNLPLFVLLSGSALSIVLFSLFLTQTRARAASERMTADLHRSDQVFKRHLERVHTLREIDQAVSSTLELQPMLDLLLEKVDSFFPHSVLIVRLVNEANGALAIAAWRNLTQEELRDVVQLNASGLSGVVLKSRQLLTINDVQADPRSLSLQTLQRHGLRSYLGVPLIAKDQAFGTLSILTKEIYKFSTEEIEFISMLAGRAAVAIHNGQLHAKLISLTSDLARSNKDLKRSEEVQRLLKDIAMAVSQSLNVNELLQIALDKVEQITGRERVYIRLKDVMTGDLSLAAQRGISEQYVQALLHSRTPGGKSDQVFESGKPLVVNDPEGTILKAETRDEGIRSIGFFPLKAQDKVIGILNVSTNKPIPFEPREVELLEAIGNVIGVAVENARLYEETKRQEKIQKLLKELSQDITSLDISALFQKVTNKVREFFKVDISDIRLMGEGGSRPPVGASGIEPGRLYKAGGSRGRAGWIVRNRRPLVIPDTTKETSIPTGDSVRDLGIRGYLAVPLFSRSGEVIGILRALTYEPREFSQSEVDILQQLANGTAIALENAHLLEETERRAQHLSALHFVATSASRSLELDTILKEVLKKIRDIFHFDVTQIYLVDPQAGELHLRAALDSRVSTELSRKKKVFHFGEGNIGRVAQTGKPVIFEDVYNDPKYQVWSSTRVSYASGFRFFAAFPIKTKNKTIGVLSGIDQSPRKLNDEEMRLVSAITDQLGVCVENSQLYEDVKKHATALERSNKVKDEFLSVMSHELRTPLTAVIGYAGMLQDGFLGDVNQEQAKGLGVLLSQTNDLLTLINSILDVTKIEAGTMVVEKEKVDVKSFLDELRSTYDTPRDKSLTLVWDYADHLPKVTTDGGKLKRILQNLVNNAIKFTDEGNVTISARVVGGSKSNGRQEEISAQASNLMPYASKSYVEFKVVDTGIGIPKEALPVIFEKFRQVDSTETRAFGGVGLGLHIVKEFTEMLGGKIAVDSEPGRGSVFTVTIPLEPQA